MTAPIGPQYVVPYVWPPTLRKIGHTLRHAEHLMQDALGAGPVGLLLQEKNRRRHGS